ncbi:hypothetical protein PILCRDRAFT_810336 [Piloderma croceum F 1598]|uniref:DRBM domain-containing protein n=1 Tax=Piloderma croceum (strain F 1598) TaxID=765440 RepID=A0A0C3GL32_PILCF|nr:hypothetical protein PILCRDRAFT_810336 [Piloderma croceum F 1598]
MSASNYRMQLNNFLQARYQNQSSLVWETHHHGSEHEGVWEAIAYINDVALGRSTAITLQAAKQEAARQVLAALLSS